MKKLTSLLLIFFIPLSASSQDAVIRKLQTESLRSVKKDIEDTAWSKWKKGGMYSISVGQGSSSNWSAGGDDFSLTIATSLNLFGFYKKNKHYWDNTLDVNFGYVSTTSLGSRKNDDRFDALSKYGFNLNSNISLATLANFRSQFLDGYTYEESSKTFASAFLSPAFLVISQGLDYKPGKHLSVFVSPITSRWVIVKDDTLSARGEYGVAPGKHSMNQLGAFATINYQKAFNK